MTASVGTTVAVTEALVDRVRARLVDADSVGPAAVAAALRAEGVVLGADTILALVKTLQDEVFGAGPLEQYLRAPEVTDVLVHGPDDTWVDRGAGLERVPVRFASEAAVRRLAQRLATSAGRRLDDASPFVDARLPDGSRLHAALFPVSRGGTTISIRVRARRGFGLDDLVSRGSVDVPGVQLLRALIAARLAFLVSGGTGSGKTTILGAMLACVPAHERLVLVEDSAELDPQHPHVVRLESRPPNAEGAGGLSVRELVRQALRMRPDRLVVGEVRGAEVVDLLAALNTGHEGGCGTVHANSALDVPARLLALGMTCGVPRDAVAALVDSGLDAVIHLIRGRDGRRALSSVGVLDRGSVREALIVRDGRSRPGPAYDVLAARMDAARMDWAPWT